MKLCEIAAAIGIENYPQAMEPYYDPQDTAPACDLGLIDSLQKEYSMFGKYYDLVREYAEKVNADPLRSAWIKTAVRFALAGDFDQAKSVPVPTPDGTLLTSMLPYYILVPQIPVSMAEYRRRGFSEEEVTDLVKVYRTSLATVENHTGLPGCNALYYGWDSHFAKCQIFKVGGLQFEMRKLTGRAAYLRDKQTGNVVPVMCSGTYHRTGIQELGSAGYTDGEGAFTCVFREDEENYYGHGAWDCVVSPQEQTFPKSRWEKLFAPGDPCLGMHIPAKADISVQAMDRAIEAARELVKTRYPEFPGSQVYCSSWLLDPTLGRLLGDSANITNFQNRYVRYPQKSAGMHVFGFVFAKNFGTYADLPEDTRLRRALKQLYLDGGHIYAYAGLIV